MSTAHRSPNFPAPMITRPFAPFTSPVDGTIISDAAQRRDHNQRNDVEDVGNDKTVFERKPPFEPQGMEQSMRRAIAEVEGV